ncbi:hypothetical protein MMYC01_207967 [Madurella mycetomatis]|uniref:Inheritance of peroxisomes protein 1 n=1 Tax=Madurella mycetomatis TaxID=100816 RepID=A0A175VUR0_9PEZI|nr:hypothetical protein MMYC01_207967 [Madurella mycetomatis]
MEFSKPPGSPLSAPRRVFTAPVRPASPQPAPSPQTTNGLVDTLYDHPSVKIVSFTAGSRSLSIGTRTAAAPDIEPGSLSWSSQFERTIAVGPFRIYRAPGSVAFLSCGSALQPILPKSQVWCVDEESSKFVLQIRRPQYWRIEVPVAEQEDAYRAQLLREVFDKILQFEKTECPFQRSFTVELPERPQTPVKKRPWTPVRRSSASLPLTPVTPVDIAPVYKGTPRGSICLGDLKSVADTRKTLAEHARSLEPPAEEPSEPQDAVPRDCETADVPSRSKPLRVESHQGRGSAPSQQTVPEMSRLKSPAESRDSFHSSESWRSTPLPPSPPLSNPGSPRSPSRPTGSEALSESPAMCLDTSSGPTTSPQAGSESTSDPAPEPAPEENPTTTATANSSENDNDNDNETFTTPRPQILRRATTSSSLSPSRRGPLSPFPPPANLFVPRQPTTTAAAATHSRPSSSSSSSSALAVVRRLPITVLHKTCEILLSPPSHLMNLMLKVAARIAAGEWRGFVFGMGEGGVGRVEVCWDWSEEDDFDGDDDDDFSRHHVGVMGRRWGAMGGRRLRGRASAVDLRGSSGGGWGGRGWTGEKEVEDGFGVGRRKGKGERMAGSFPESDEDDSEVSDGEEEGKEELLRPEREDGDDVVKDKGVTAGIRKDSDESAEEVADADAEWGVD